MKLSGGHRPSRPGLSHVGRGRPAEPGDWAPRQPADRAALWRSRATAWTRSPSDARPQSEPDPVGTALPRPGHVEESLDANVLPLDVRADEARKPSGGLEIV